MGSLHVLEKESRVYNLPRAVHFVDENDNLILDWPRPRQITDNGFYPSYRFHQPDLEKILRKNLALNSNLQICYNTELMEVENKGKDVKAKCINKATNISQTIYADYVVGFDGANSFVKKII